MAIRIRRLLLGGALLLAGLTSFLYAADRRDWLPATGRVLSISTSCKLEAVEYGIFTRTTRSAELACAGVDRFKATHPESPWKLTTLYDGEVDVQRGGAHNTVTMRLQPSGGQTPAKGDRLNLLQDPANPARVALASAVVASPYFAIAFAVLGALCLWWGMRTPKPRFRASAEPTAALEASANYSTPAPSLPPASPYYPRNSAPLFTPRKPFGRRGR